MDLCCGKSCAPTLVLVSLSFCDCDTSTVSKHHTLRRCRTEDWMPDSASHRWSYYAARMRSAIALSNRTGPEQEFSGYIVVGSSGAQEGG